MNELELTISSIKIQTFKEICKTNVKLLIKELFLNNWINHG